MSLITLARSGDGNAFADLTVTYKPLIDSMSKTYAAKCGNSMYTEDDFVQEASLGFYSAVCTYKESEKVTFGLYAKICVRNRLVSLLRAAAKKKKELLKKNEESERFVEPEYRFFENENAVKIEKELERVLSKLEWSVFSLYMENKSYKEIAEILGRSVKTVDNAIYRIKNKLKGKYDL